MFSNRIARKLALPVMSLCAAFIFSSCDRTEETDPDDIVNPYVLSLAIQGSNNNFSYYTVPFADVMSGTLSAEGRGIEQPGYFDFTKIDNTIYSIGGLDDVNVVGISKNENGSLRQIGNVSFANSLSDIVKADNNTLIGVEMAAASDVVRFHRISANTVTVTSTTQHPVSDLTAVGAPFYSGMRISGNHLFLSYYIMDPTTWETPHTDEAKIAVYSYPGLEFQQVIEDTRTGPIGGFNTKTGLIRDEKGDIYALSHSNPANGYSQTTKPGGILRINSGATTIDQNYLFDVQALTGGLNVAHLLYLGNGKAFAEINTQTREEQARWTDGPLRSAVIDLYNKTVTYIEGLPQHPGDGRRLAALHQGKYVYTCITENNRMYVYRTDLDNHTATRGAEVEATFVAGFFKL